MRGTIAQLVEQRTENPCVPGSIPGGTTSKSAKSGQKWLDFFLIPVWGFCLMVFDLRTTLASTSSATIDWLSLHLKTLPTWNGDKMLMEAGF